MSVVGAWEANLHLFVLVFRVFGVSLLPPIGELGKTAILLGMVTASPGALPGGIDARK